jgi:REP element-mobilizing transposase RayT
MVAASLSRPGHLALRRGRVSLPGQIYFVTFTTYRRMPLFSHHRLASVASAALACPQAWQHSRLLAWVLMPDHWHGLIQLGDETEELSKIVGRLKSNSSRRLHAEDPGLGPVWARAFHDRALRSDDNVLSAVRYLISNPLRAGLVRRVGDYPYWDATWL